MIIGVGMTATAKSLSRMLLGSLFVGARMGLGPPVAILYVVEVSPPFVRGTYRGLTRIRGRTIKARIEFEKLWGGVHVKGAMVELSKSIRGDRSYTTRLSKLLFGCNFRVMFIGSTLFALQQLSVINVVFYFSSTVFESFGEPSDIANICVGIGNLLGLVDAMILMDKLGWKVLFLGRFRGIAMISCHDGSDLGRVYTLASWLGMMPITQALVYDGTTFKDLSDVMQVSKSALDKALAECEDMDGNA
ncbi:hypothetical protein VNO77_44614 [Canavalia gladiata]|uniref:Uncharacterized protein n=1 Tax=Canavalia gladiata TaxID=3824 RepID=A0AAN9PQW7_CANGL